MKICATGHRPDKLGGYDSNNPLRLAIKEQIREQIIKLAPAFAYSGMALGVDQDFAAICLSLSVPFIAAIPFKGQESRWPAESQRVYLNLLNQAYSVYYV